MQRGDLMELNFEGLEMQKWNIPMDRTWRVDEKNAVIFLVIMFAPRVMVITMVNRFWSYRLRYIEGRNIKKQLSQQKINKLLYLHGLISC